VKNPRAKRKTHKIKVIRLTMNPFLAQLQDLSLIIAATATTSEAGGINRIATPPRDTKILPQPKPGMFNTLHNNTGMVKIHGDIASPKLNFPNLSNSII
jgi:hypothetical protein